ncbi:uncharacterized protein JCM10292_004700 [Rhodotorula paludigena]|uniref:uncharacterized protein n=1 Tax=Rhodotorula paludigena TaxID=86838 RepID=UPI00316EFD61
MSEPAQNPTEEANAAVAPSPPVPLALPAPSDDTAGTLEVNGQAFSLFDKMGPTVVNSDGTLSRIVDWDIRTPAERANILRVLGKRNQLRLDSKKAELAAQEGQAQEESK